MLDGNYNCTGTMINDTIPCTFFGQSNNFCEVVKEFTLLAAVRNGKYTHR